MTYFVVFVVFVHATIALVFGDDLASVLNDDLIWIKASIASYTVASISGLYNFNPYSVLSAALAALLQIGKSAVLAMSATSSAIAIVTLIKHDSVLAINITSIVWRADTLGREAVKER